MTLGRERAFVSFIRRAGHLIKMNSSLSAVSVKTGEKNDSVCDKRLENLGTRHAKVVKADQAQSNQIAAKKAATEGHLGVCDKRLENVLWGAGRSDKKLGAGCFSEVARSGVPGNMKSALHSSRERQTSLL